MNEPTTTRTMVPLCQSGSGSWFLSKTNEELIAIGYHALVRLTEAERGGESLSRNRRIGLEHDLREAREILKFRSDLDDRGSRFYIADHEWFHDHERFAEDEVLPFMAHRTRELRHVPVDALEAYGAALEKLQRIWPASRTNDVSWIPPHLEQVGTELARREDFAIPEPPDPVEADEDDDQSITIDIDDQEIT